MLKARLWNGRALKGTWHFTIKVDGVRALWEPARGTWWSRADKPLYNIPDPGDPSVPHDCEVYLGSLKDSVRAVRTQHLKDDTPRVTLEHLYEFLPLDPRLDCGERVDPDADTIQRAMKAANELGFEGLVLRQGDTWLKVKPSDNADMLVLGIAEGEGKHAGRMGYLVTSKGDVGTGFTDEERAEWWARRETRWLPDPPFLTPPKSADSLEGAVWKVSHNLQPLTIEVSFMHLTPDGKFRHSAFVRERFDKIAEE